MSLSAEEIKDANIAYHDAAADEYDAKWGIDYGDLGRTQVAIKTRKVLGKRPKFERGLEIGSGTGYFSLNMMQNGYIDEVVCTDISQGMLDVVERSADRLGYGDRVSTLHTAAENF
ncbi:MAG: class I SAM-dependent methyltransferase, partial [Solirubrobacterales bacterium]